MKNLETIKVEELLGVKFKSNIDMIVCHNLNANSISFLVRKPNGTLEIATLYVDVEGRSRLVGSDSSEVQIVTKCGGYETYNLKEMVTEARLGGINEDDTSISIVKKIRDCVLFSMGNVNYATREDIENYVKDTEYGKYLTDVLWENREVIEELNKMTPTFKIHSAHMSDYSIMSATVQNILDLDEDNVHDFSLAYPGASRTLEPTLVPSSVELIYFNADGTLQETLELEMPLVDATSKLGTKWLLDKLPNQDVYIKSTLGFLFPLKVKE